MDCDIVCDNFLDEISSTEEFRAKEIKIINFKLN